MADLISKLWDKKVFHEIETGRRVTRVEVSDEFWSSLIKEINPYYKPGEKPPIKHFLLGLIIERNHDLKGEQFYVK